MQERLIASHFEHFVLARISSRRVGIKGVYHRESS